jgi:hypothetical protein
MALLSPRYLSGMPQGRWVVLCLFLLFAILIQGAGRAIEVPAGFAPVQISGIHLPGEDHSDHPCTPGDREGKGHIHCDCTSGPGCSSIAIIGEMAAAPTGLKLALFQPRVQPLVSSKATSHFRPPRSSTSA